MGKIHEGSNQGLEKQIPHIFFICRPPCTNLDGRIEFEGDVNSDQVPKQGWERSEASQSDNKIHGMHNEK